MFGDREAIYRVEKQAVDIGVCSRDVRMFCDLFISARGCGGIKGGRGSLRSSFRTSCRRVQGGSAIAGERERASTSGM